MTFLYHNIILDIVRSELTAKQRRTASRAMRKIASIVVFYVNDSTHVRLMPYIDKELTNAEENVVLEIEEILSRSVDRLLDAIEENERKKKANL